FRVEGGERCAIAADLIERAIFPGAQITLGVVLGELFSHRRHFVHREPVADVGFDSSGQLYLGAPSRESDMCPTIECCFLGLLHRELAEDLRHQLPIDAALLDKALGGRTATDVQTGNAFHLPGPAIQWQRVERLLRCWNQLRRLLFSYRCGWCG